ncbi:oxidoreductase, short chain dehydrogenase/reductase family [Aspergillus stella-maris]|uniref:oxidoreductase, short chain dehydrogenase/reductase family n=1 Tax=Aspergillus stella-maris TaxID=1810926 RepID=UPI003CCD0A7C
MSNFISVNKLKNTRVLLLGGTSGVGYAVARAALEHGASVIVASSSETKVKNAISSLKELYPESPYVNRIAGQKCDLSNDEIIESEILELYKFATSKTLFPQNKDEQVNVKEEGDIIPINHIVFTAGSIPQTLPPTDSGVNVPYLRSLNTVRFVGAALLAKHAPTYMPPAPESSATAPYSSITFTSGALLERPMPGMTFGLAGIGQVHAQARGLAIDLAQFGIRVNTVMLGPVETPIFNTLGGPEVVEGIKRGFGERTLLGRLGDAGDAAEMFLGLMRDGNITGEVVRSDAGFVLKG